tara:strand:+ start:53 stop:838 length:786 start_codon:yes stop_codon:yes gene_type:complete
MLEQLLREIGDDASVCEVLPSALRTLRTSAPLQACSSHGAPSEVLSSSWCERVSTLLQHKDASVRFAGLQLLEHTCHQCSETTFANHRAIWSSALLSMAASASEAPRMKRRALSLLLLFLHASSSWPQQRREMLTQLPRILGLLLPMLSQDEPAQRAALLALLQISSEAPHALRSYADKLGGLLPRLLLGSRPRVAAAAATLIGSLPTCFTAAHAAERWLQTVRTLVGTLQAKSHKPQVPSPLPHMPQSMFSHASLNHDPI